MFRGKVLKPYIGRQGPIVSLLQDGIRRQATVARLVYCEFIEPLRDDQRVYCADGDCVNVHPANLTLRAPRKTHEELTYAGAHKRVHSSRGSASSYACAIRCGRQARDWSYTGDDSDQKLGPVVARNPDSTWSFYSTDPAYYEPLCRWCHKERDGRLQRQQLRAYREWTIRNPGKTLSDMDVVA